MRVEMRKDSEHEIMRCTDIGFYECLVVVKNLRVSEWWIGDAEEVVFGNLGFVNL